jgi:DNA-binding IclR family transcriptional regulator
MVERRQNILDFLSQGQANLVDISAAVGLPESNTQNRLQDMAEEGLVKCVEVDGQTFYELLGG